MHGIFGFLLVVLLPCADIVNGRAVVKKSNNLNGIDVKEIEVNMHPKVIKDIGIVQPLDPSELAHASTETSTKTESATWTTVTITTSAGQAATAGPVPSILSPLDPPESGIKPPKIDNGETHSDPRDDDGHVIHRAHEDYPPKDHLREDHPLDEPSHETLWFTQNPTQSPEKGRIPDIPGEYSVNFWLFNSKAQFPIANLTTVCGNYTWEHLMSERHRLYHNQTVMLAFSPNIPDSSRTETKEVDREVNIMGCHCLHRKDYNVPCSCEQAMADRAKISARVFFAMVIVVVSVLLGFIVHYIWHIGKQCVENPRNVDWRIPDHRPKVLDELCSRSIRAEEEQLRKEEELRNKGFETNLFTGIGGDVPRLKAEKAKHAARERTWWMRSYRAMQSLAERFPIGRR